MYQFHFCSPTLIKGHFSMCPGVFKAQIDSEKCQIRHFCVSVFSQKRDIYCLGVRGKKEVTWIHLHQEERHKGPTERGGMDRRKKTPREMLVFHQKQSFLCPLVSA